MYLRFSVHYSFSHVFVQMSILFGWKFSFAMNSCSWNAESFESPFLSRCTLRNSPEKENNYSYLAWSVSLNILITFICKWCVVLLLHFCRWLILEIIFHYVHIDQTLYLQFWWNERNVFVLSFLFLFLFPLSFAILEINKRTNESLKSQLNHITRCWPMCECCTLSLFGSLYSEYETYSYRKIDKLKCKARSLDVNRSTNHIQLKAPDAMPNALYLVFNGGNNVPFSSKRKAW